MSDREFENYLALLTGMLRLRRTQREGIAGELRDHLIEHVAHLESNGITHEEAVRRALEEFGDAAALAAGFQALVGMRRRRLIMRCTIGTTIVMTGLVVALLAFRPEVRNDRTVVQAQDEAKTESPAGKDAVENKTIGVSQRVANSRNEKLNAATRKKLDELISVDMSETPLREALGQFSKMLGVQFYFDPKALVDLGITPDDPITLNLKDVPGDMAIDLALRPIQLAYTLRNGVVMVTSQSEIDAHPETRVYFVPEHSALELAQLIPSITAPNTWDISGGVGSMRVFRDSLIVSQTSEVHQKIEQLLKDLEPVLAKEPKRTPEEAAATGDGGGSRGGYGSAGGGGYGAAGGYGGSRGGYGSAGGRAGYGGGGGYGAAGRARAGYGGGQPGYGGAGYGAAPATNATEAAPADAAAEPEKSATKTDTAVEAK
jgi:hypothetical protein